MRPTAKSLVLDLLSTLRSGAMPVRALVEAGRIFAIRENSIRVALARLRAESAIERDERGAYRLGATAFSVHARIASWRRFEDRMRSWNRGWLAVHTGALVATDRRAAKERRRALTMLGMAELRAGLSVRPDNLAGGLEGFERELLRLGLPSEAPVFSIREFSADDDRRARSLWPTSEIERGYRERIRGLRASADRLGRLPTEEAMGESFLVGGEAMRALLLDPMLPDPIVATEKRRALVAELAGYDKLGRTCWAPFMRSYDLPAAAPADHRLAYADESNRRQAQAPT